MPVVDGHTHLDHTRSGDEPWPAPEALDAAAAVGVDRVVQIGCELDSAAWTVDLVRRDARVLGGVALHPSEAARIVDEAADPAAGQAQLAAALARVEELARSEPRIRVIGETGLDHYWTPPEASAARAAQEHSFRAHIAMAKRLDRVLQIHDRDAHDDVLRVLLEEGAPPRTVFHCFSGDAAMARFCADQGWYLSFAGPITFRSNEEGRAALRAAPRELVLVETDAPYLAPHPLRGKPNAGYLMPWTVRRMAEELDVRLDTFCDQLSRTAEALYGPWEGL